MDRLKSERLMRWATRASVATALTLVVVKLYAWWQSSSVAMLGSATDSGLDLLASLVTFYAVATALEPADDQHRFGHGKAEALAGLFQGAVMGGSALFLILESARQVIAPQAIQATNLVMQVSLFAILITLALVVFQAYVVRHTQSLAISGDHLHYKGDLLLNFGVILAAFLTARGFVGADGLFGIGIALYIGWGAFELVRPAIDMLMDREFSEEERESIFNLVMESPGVLGMHELKTRTAGRDRFIQMHIDVDADLTVRQAHIIADEVETTLGEVFADTEILIHVDPPSENSDKMTGDEIIA